MIPANSALLATELEVQSHDTRSYAMNLDTMEIRGYCEGLDAMHQALFLRLSVERYRHPIYSWRYGVETMDLYGRPRDYVCVELERRIREALLEDDRVRRVQDFSFDTSRPGDICAAFTVVTEFGELRETKVVSV